MKVKVVIVVVVLPLLLLALALAGGSVLVWRLLAVTLAIPLLCYLWVFFGIRGLDAGIKRSSERYQAGEWFDEEVSVRNRSGLPKLMVRFKEDSELPGHDNSAILNLSPRSSHHWNARAYCARRGKFKLGPMTATTTDPFGFFSLRRSMGETQEILVYPATVELPYFEAIVRHEPGNDRAHWLTSESRPDAAHVREYTSGDSLNRIHWQSTAHTGKLMVKVFDPDRSSYSSRTVWVVLDLHQNVQSADGTAEECGITVAASLLKKYIESGKDVGFIAAGDQPYFFPPLTGSQHLWHLLEALALAAATGSIPVDQLIRQEAGRFGIESTVVVITAASGEGLASSLRQVKKRGATTAAVLLDSYSFGGMTSAANTATNLMSSGIRAYVVRRGDDLRKALDSRTGASQAMFLNHRNPHNTPVKGRSQGI